MIWIFPNQCIIHAQATHPKQHQTHFSLRVGRQQSCPCDKAEFLIAVVTSHLPAHKLWLPKKALFLWHFVLESHGNEGRYSPSVFFLIFLSD